MAMMISPSRMITKDGTAKIFLQSCAMVCKQHDSSFLARKIFLSREGDWRLLQVHVTVRGTRLAKAFKACFACHPSVMQRAAD